MALGFLLDLVAEGQWIDRSEHVNLNELFERVSRHFLVFKF
jgi:hypothetical protein